MKIGEIIPADREITLNEGKKTTKILVANKGDRPVQVGSHFHFFEVNKCLSFDREAAYGYHLDIPSGTSVRFEPGEEKEVTFTITPDDLKFYDEASAAWKYEPGKFKAYVCASSADVRGVVSFEMQ